MENQEATQWVLGWLFVAGALTGVVGTLAAVWARLRRRRASVCWLVATVGFAVAGALSILSIGLLFVVAAAATGIAAARSAARPSTESDGGGS